MYLSRNFTLHEMTRSHTADRLDIDNSLPGDKNNLTVQALTSVCCNVLEPVREHFGRGFVPSSAYRSEPLEKVLTHKSFSRLAEWRPDKAWSDYFERKQHPKGEAVDFEVPGTPNIWLAQWIEKNLSFDQLILEFYKKGDPTSGWVHVSYVRSDLNRGEVLSIIDGKTNKGLPK